MTQRRAALVVGKNVRILPLAHLKSMLHNACGVVEEQVTNLYHVRLNDGRLAVVTRDEFEIKTGDTIK